MLTFYNCFTIDVYNRTGKLLPIREIFEELIFNPGYRVVVYYRLSCYLKNTKYLKRLGRLISELIIVRLQRVPGVEFRNRYEIGAGLNVYHPHDIVIGAGVRIGKNVTICNGVTLGARTLLSLDEIKDKDKRYPVIGNGVTVFSGAKVMGPIEIGDNSVIGANAVVNRSFPANSIIAGIPARLIRTIK
jgi:serine O-acetyltransferase